MIWIHIGTLCKLLGRIYNNGCVNVVIPEAGG